MTMLTIFLYLAVVASVHGALEKPRVNIAQPTKDGIKLAVTNLPENSIVFFDFGDNVMETSPTGTLYATDCHNPVVDVYYISGNDTSPVLTVELENHFKAAGPPTPELKVNEDISTISVDAGQWFQKLEYIFTINDTSFKSYLGFHMYMNCESQDVEVHMVNPCGVESTSETVNMPAQCSCSKLATEVINSPVQRAVVIKNTAIGLHYFYYMWGEDRVVHLDWTISQRGETTIDVTDCRVTKVYIKTTYYNGSTAMAAVALPESELYYTVPAPSAALWKVEEQGFARITAPNWYRSTTVKYLLSSDTEQEFKTYDNFELILPISLNDTLQLKSIDPCGQESNVESFRIID